jgi:hypothetical protein
MIGVWGRIFNMEGERDMIAGVVSPNDLVALRVILQLYERHIWNTAAPSAKKSRQIVEIDFLVVKLSFYEGATVLTVDDVERIKMALGTFIGQVRLKGLGSIGGDGVLESCEQLLAYFSKIYQ